MGINNSQVCLFGTEMTAAVAGATIPVATAAGIAGLTQNPVMLIFDNQGTVPIAIYVNGTAASNLWRTFPGGEALVLDMRGNHGIAANFTPVIGTTFFANGASGTFSISYTFAQNQ